MTSVFRKFLLAFLYHCTYCTNAKHRMKLMSASKSRHPWEATMVGRSNNALHAQRGTMARAERASRDIWVPATGGGRRHRRRLFYPGLRSTSDRHPDTPRARRSAHLGTGSQCAGLPLAYKRCESYGETGTRTSMPTRGEERGWCMGRPQLLESASSH